MSWISRIVNSMRPGRAAAALDEELRFHLEERADELARQGLPREEAERQARLKFGHALTLRESSYDLKSAAWLGTLARDFRFGFRMLAKHRAATAAAILSLGLAMGAATAAFTLIDALIFRPLPVPAPGRLIRLAHTMPAFFSPDNEPHEADSFSYPAFHLLREQAAPRASLFAMQLSAGLRPAIFDDSGGVSENVRAESISGSGFEILGVQPALGRLIQPADDSAATGHAVAVLSYPFWKRRFGSSPSALGRWVMLGGQQFQIVGVASRSFAGVQPGYLTDLWLPLSPAAGARELADPDNGLAQIWGRVRTIEDRARLEGPLQAVFTNFMRERVRLNPPRNLHGELLRQFTEAPLHVHDASSGRDSLFRLQFRRPLLILALICGLLLLVACSNVASLMVARASARNSEMAVRLSLGASRKRLMQQLLIESLQTAAGSCALGVMLAAALAPALVSRLGTTEFPAWVDTGLGLRTLGFAAGLGVLGTLLCGFAPAMRASAVAPGAALKTGNLGHGARLGSLRALLTTQVGFSVTLLFLSGLLLLSFRKLTTVDLGFTSNNVVLFDLAARDSTSDPATHSPAAAAKLLESIRHLPAVSGASLTRQRPMGGDMVWIMTPIVRFPGRGNEAIRPTEVPVSDGFFEAMQIRRIGGRDFLPQELSGPSPSVIVNQAFADRFFPHDDATGKTFVKLTDDPDPIPQQIVGVVANVRYNNLRETAGPTIYSPLREAAGATLNVRTASRAASLTPWLRKEIEAAAPELTVRRSILLSSQIDNTMIQERLLALLAGFFSLVSLLLASMGIYGVINYATLRRTREMGIRVALGASRAAVVRLIAAGAALPVTIGIALGIGAGLSLARYLASQLFGTQPSDFWSLAGPIVCTSMAAAAAVLLPAMRAARADPLVSLRYE